MPNLRDRLKRIQESKKNEPDTVISIAQKNKSAPFLKGWESVGFNVLKRTVIKKLSFKPLKSLPASSVVFIPDLAGADTASFENFLFFDLETTGLGGAGTAAFLSAFGKFIGTSLHITQYLLLDYPGENDFLENTLKELKTENAVIVSFNGKSFDSQIIKSRCLQNRIKTPDYRHADLLHPSRRLWKNIIENCSQASIESGILGIERKDDIPGALAPEIWFEFLKTGRTDRLTGICDHNIYDISGLASILNAILLIAQNPVNCEYRYNAERIALYWRKYLRSKNEYQKDNDLKAAGEELLRFAACNDYKNALYIYAYDQMRNGNYDEAYKYVLRAIEIFDKESIQYQKLLRRKERLEKKLRLDD